MQDVIPWHPAAFELFGYDVLIDSELKPWLIEVNSSPSLARDNALDHEIKNALLRDVLSVLDAPAVDRVAVKEVLQVGWCLLGAPLLRRQMSCGDMCCGAAPPERSQATVQHRRCKIGSRSR